MKLGSRVLVIDCRPNCSIGPHLCKTLVDLGLSIRCLLIISKSDYFKNAGDDCDDSNCSVKASPNYSHYKRILGHRSFSDVEFQSVAVPATSSLISHNSHKSHNDAGIDADTRRALKNSLLYLCRQITRIFMIFEGPLTLSDSNIHQSGYWSLINLLHDVANSHNGIINPITLRPASASLSETLVPLAIICPTYCCCTSSVVEQRQNDKQQRCQQTNDDFQIQTTDKFLIVVIQHCCLLISSVFFQDQKLLDTKKSLEGVLLERWWADGAGARDHMEVNGVQSPPVTCQLAGVKAAAAAGREAAAAGCGIIKRCIMVEDFCDLVLSEVERAVSSVTLDKRVVKCEIDGSQPTDEESLSAMMSVAEFQGELDCLLTQLISSAHQQPGSQLSPSNNKPPDRLRWSHLLRFNYYSAHSVFRLGSLLNAVCCLRRAWRRVEKNEAAPPLDNVEDNSSCSNFLLQLISENGSSLSSSSSQSFRVWTKKALRRGFERLRETHRRLTESQQQQQTTCNKTEQQQPQQPPQRTLNSYHNKKRRFCRKTIQFPLFAFGEGGRDYCEENEDKENRQNNNSKAKLIKNCIDRKEQIRLPQPPPLQTAPTLSDSKDRFGCFRA